MPRLARSALDESCPSARVQGLGYGKLRQQGHRRQQARPRQRLRLPLWLRRDNPLGITDPALLLRYLEAYALHSAGIVEAKSIYEAAGIDKRTGASYEQVLENVFVVESLPAWKTNRLKRLVQSPKRYLLDAGLMAAVLRMDQAAILCDDKMLGRVIDTFVASQLRARSRYAPPGRACITCAIPTGGAKLTSSQSLPGNASWRSR
jgi:Domain of unknown function (DUF4143)